MKIPNFGDKGDQLLKSFKTKFKHHLTKEVKFKVKQSTQKLLESFYTNMKDQIPKLMKFYSLYQFNYPGCNNSYVGKTERHFCTRPKEHTCSDK